ncbi:MAG TPA: S9 family peptidase [Anaerolineales bacterium]|nr:S9 family peptidase [Anaerolineales bacterium]
MLMPAKRRLKAEDLYRFQLIKDLRISPDGQWVVYMMERVDAKQEKKYTNLWLASTDGRRAPQPFTTGDHNDTMPRWSPNGKIIAFISNRHDEKQPQIYLIPLDGGEARQLTRDLKGQFGALEWSPDGKQLLIQFRQTDPEVLEREKDETRKKRGVVDRPITRLHYKLDGAGFLPKERWHLWLVDVRSGKARQLTQGEQYEEWDPAWSPDGQHIVFCSNRQPDPDRDPEAIDLYLIPAQGGEMQRLPAPVGQKSMPRFSPDGRWIAYYGTEGRGAWWRNTGLWVLPAEGDGPAQNLTAPFDLHAAVDVINDLIGAAFTPPPQWSPDGQWLYFPVSRHGRSELRRIHPAGSGMETLIARDGVVGAFDLSADGQHLVYFFGTLTDPGQVWSWNRQTNRHRPLTRLNAWLKRVNLGQTQEVWFTAEDGYRLQGWILTPPDFDPQKRYPTIVEIHGGPITQYGFLMMHEFYYLAAQGYVVAFSNPRGGRGYGETHARAIVGDWGNRDYADLMAFADFVQSQPYVEAERMGVTGGSYGGYMTLWIVGHTHRFRAAVAQRSVSNLVNFWGSSDMNWLTEHLIGIPKPPWEALEDYWRVSPLAYLHQAKTPTLIIHSENDLRCPVDQGEQAYVALKYTGVDTELVLFPEESHGLSRGGRTDRRIARLKHILRWMDRYLKG